MKKLLLIAEDPLDQCSYYRLWPWRKIRGLDRIIEFRSYGNLKPEDFLSTDAAVFLRPWTDGNANAMALAKRLHVKVIADYDDDFLNLEEHHYFAQRFSSFEARKTLAQIAGLCDHLTVSTSPIWESYRALRSDLPATIIPNVADLSFTPLPEGPNMESNVVIWRGSYSHNRDLELIYPLWEKFKACKFVAIGAFHHSLPKRFPNVTFYTFQGMADYFELIKKLKPRAFLVPLRDTLFNRCKSNCAWLEATCAGAVVVASALPEWDDVGILTTECDNADVWRSGLEIAIGETENLFRSSSKSVDDPALKCGWGVSQMREDVLEKVDAL